VASEKTEKRGLRWGLEFGSRGRLVRGGCGSRILAGGSAAWNRCPLEDGLGVRSNCGILRLMLKLFVGRGAFL